MGNTTLIRLAAAAAGGALAFAAAAPALAQDLPPGVPLQESHQGLTAKAGEAEEWDRECGAGEFNDFPFGGIPAGFDGWHFVVQPSDFVELTLQFDTGDGDEFITIDDTGAGAYTGWIRDDQAGHAFLFTPAGWTLVNGSAVVEGDRNFFVVSHTCAGEPDDENGDKTPSPKPSEPGDETPAPTETPTAPGNGEKPGDENGEEDDDDELPVTGAQVGGIVVLGVGLLAGGIAMLAVRRRRDLSSLIDG